MFTYGAYAIGLVLGALLTIALVTRGDERAPCGKERDALLHGRPARANAYARARRPCHQIIKRTRSATLQLRASFCFYAV